MSGIIALTCPNCGAKLEITQDMDRFACAHCGAEHLVERHGGTVSLDPVIDRLEEIKVGSDRTASELAIQRLTKELNPLAEEINDIYVPPYSDVKSARLFAILCTGIGVLFLIGTILPALLGDSGGPSGLSILIGLGLPSLGYLTYRNKSGVYKQSTKKRGLASR